MPWKDESSTDLAADGHPEPPASEAALAWSRPQLEPSAPAAYVFAIALALPLQKRLNCAVEYECW